MASAFIITLLFKKSFLSHSPLPIENKKHGALKTNKPENGGNKYKAHASPLCPALTYKGSAITGLRQ